MKTTVEIADPLFLEAKELASKQGITIRVLLEDGLRRAIEARKAVDAKPFKLRDGSVNGEGLVDPSMTWEQIRDLCYGWRGGSVLPGESLGG